MQAKSGSQALPVKKGNGIMTVIPVNKGQSTIKLTYTPPHTMLLIILSILGIIRITVIIPLPFLTGNACDPDLACMPLLYAIGSTTYPSLFVLCRIV